MPNVFIQWVEGKKKQQKQTVVDGVVKAMEKAGIDKEAVVVSFIETSPDNISKGGVFFSERGK